jgi:ribosome-binding protein aMBF1 (putative translation factor)
MPKTQVSFYRDERGRSPVVEWLSELKESNAKAWANMSTPTKAKTEKRKTTDAVKILDAMAGDSPELARLTEEARVNAKVAQLIYDARQQAGLTQAELALRIGTRQGVISRLEDADYEGHSLNMLLRVASALGQQVSIEFHAPAKLRLKGGHRRKPAPALS